MNKQNVTCRTASMTFTIDNILNLKQNQNNLGAQFSKVQTVSRLKNDSHVAVQRRLGQGFKPQAPAKTNSANHNGYARVRTACGEDTTQMIDTCPRAESTDSCDDISTQNKPNAKTKTIAKKKTRTIFSKRQIFQLEATFDMKRYLSSAERACLANSLQLTENQIKIWFQNRRNKLKRQLSTDIEGPVVGEHLSDAGKNVQLPTLYKDSDILGGCFLQMPFPVVYPAANNAPYFYFSSSGKYVSLFDTE